MWFYCMLCQQQNMSNFRSVHDCSRPMHLALIFRSCCRDTARVVTNTNPLTHRHPPKALISSYNVVNYILDRRPVIIMHNYCQTIREGPFGKYRQAGLVSPLSSPMDREGCFNPSSNQSRGERR